ncbi:MAG TPA: multiheme c-type cytochrome [Polyangiales bacterium]|nr:multiheme c-type cytochrome [Polyangiales bacterium]
MRTQAILLPLAAASLLACSKAEPKPAPAAKPQPQALTATTSPVLRAKLPRDDGPFFPSQIRVEGDKPIDAAALADIEACAGCHQEAAREWSASAHAHASFDNPWYRSSVDALRDEVGFEASRHCGGCHDPVLTLAGAMDREVKPEDPRVAVGVTCLVCHSVRAATSDGNASYVLTSAPVPYPVPGDAASLQAHRDRLAAKPLRTPALCVSCHRGFLGRHTGIGHHLSGMDDPGSWRGSAHAGTGSNTPEPVKAQTCAECHMRPEPVKFEEAAAKNGTIRSHRFAGAHTAIAALSGDPRQTEVLEQQLRSGIVLDAPVIWRNGEAKLSSELREVAAGDRLALDVTVRNLAVGHSFPGGVKDMQDTWIELQVRDARGREIAHAGTRHARSEDPTAFVMRALQVDAEGRPETRHVVTRFGTVAYDHTVPPLGARTVRYSWTVPQGSAGALRVQARVMHRRHRQEAREFACEATRSERGRAFVAAAPKRLDRFFDGCREEPITQVASIDLALGQDDPRRPTWERLYDHALGLSLSIQEDLGEAHDSAERALKELEPVSGVAPDQRAKLLTLLGRISARQGRLEEALGYAERAQALIGDHPAVHRVRADAYAQVWRWKEAATALTECTRLAPGDTAAFRDLAKARFSAGDASGALQAAHSGLALQPRDEGLLRVQALALEATNSPDAAAARKAFLFYREADETTAARMACDRRVPNCLRDRDPVVKIDLDPPRMLVRTAR